ncbi:mechanosensitive ion channel domain-containing protein [Jannaschia formosa]|uniref:mechanosensitive ion channel domain-containing protein n=1 Tax=Jannaschia formosa TaxID=2259592 RepID=UPI000E1C0171|nr:mechanosensitive ion channel domain-containing protein [Jannaschia formosa]TFL18766.1 mechanosensitive ion channel [Jannaschia formosa]
MTALTAQLTVAFRRVVLSLLVCFGLVLPALAQEAPPAAAEGPDPRAALAEILRDEASREALIAELERLAGAGDAVVEETTPAEIRESFTRQVAVATQGAVQSIASGASSAWAALQRAPDVLGNFGQREIGILLDAFGDLLLVIASTIVAFVVLRFLARRLYVRMDVRAGRGDVVQRWLLLFASVLIDAAVVVVAWAIGYGLAATVIGQFGEIAIRQSLYLNAFLAVEMVKVAVRFVVSPTGSVLRPLPISDAGARRLYRSLNLGISMIGYGLLLIVPIVNANASFAAGNSVAAVIIILTALQLGTAAVRHRAPVADWLLAQNRTPVDTSAEPATAPIVEEGETVVAETSPDGAYLAKEPPRSGLYASLARRWHIGALLWLALVVVMALTQPVRRVVDFLEASGLIGAALIFALLVSGMLSRAVGRGVRLPAHVNERLPRLETRLNGFVPQMLTVIRIALLIGVALFVLDAARIFDFGGWFRTERGLSLIGTVLSVFAILVVAFVLYLALSSWVEYRLNPQFGTVPTAREQTLLTLLRNALTIALLIITLMFALSEIGLDIGPLLASAGVLGLAIGFGAQKLVQDVITGVFIQFENAMNVGDVVTAGPVTGVVEKLTIRSVSLRDLHGVYHLIPFSSVDAVSNFMRDFSFFVADMGIAYREDIEEAKQAMFEAFEELRADPDHGPTLIGDLEWFGLNQFGDSAVIVRARIKTLPGKQWGVGRAYNGIVKRIFDARGIEIPFPHRTIYLGENKKGDTQALRVEPAAPATEAEG